MSRCLKGSTGAGPCWCWVRSAPLLVEALSGAGVYLTTEAAGAAVEGYRVRAQRLHGGHAVSLVVRRRLSQLWPDPDDADLSVGAIQWVTWYVPPEDIVEWQ